MKKSVLFFLMILLVLSITACFNNDTNHIVNNNAENTSEDGQNDGTNEDMMDEEPILHIDNGFLIQKDENSERWLITQYREDGSIIATWFSLTEDTQLETSDGEPLTFGDLKVGQQVKAWYKGALNESYPEQAQAAKLVLLEQDNPAQGYSIPDIIHTAINVNKPELFWAVQSTKFIEEEQLWEITLVDAANRDETTIVRMDANNGEVLPNIALANDAFRLFAPEPQSQVGSTFTVQGEARVFEGAFSWTLEDGHSILAEGNEFVEEGAPAWSPFEFEVNYTSASNSTLTLILFVYSAKDGNPEHELMVPLTPPDELIQYDLENNRDSSS